MFGIVDNSFFVSICDFYEVGVMLIIPSFILSLFSLLTILKNSNLKHKKTIINIVKIINLVIVIDILVMSYFFGDTTVSIIIGLIPFLLVLVLQYNIVIIFATYTFLFGIYKYLKNIMS